MADTAQLGPAFEALTQLAQLSRAGAHGLPAQVDIRPHWSGIGFSLLGRNFVAPLGEVSEMLEVPEFTHLPGVQPWVQGVANVRGRLLPIFDMAMFYGQRLTGSRKQRRVLILETETLYTGLLVDQVLGMQHFPIDDFQDDAGPVEDQVRPYTSGSYMRENERWTVFRPALLAEDPRFINAAKS